MNFQSIKKVTISSLLIVLSSSSVADVEVTRYEQNKTATIVIKNKIQYDDDDRFEAELKSLEDEGYKLKLNAVVLNTRGGNKSSAREIGKLIRSKELNTYVAPKALCRSACIYILSGGITRMAYGEVSVHRATYTDDMPIEKLANALKVADNEASAFIESMGLSPLVSDAILMTPNWAIREFTMREKERMGVHATERVSEAMWFRKVAQSLDIPTNEFVAIFLKHYDRCDRKARNFQMTLYECVETVAAKK